MKTHNDIINYFESLAVDFKEIDHDPQMDRIGFLEWSQEDEDEYLKDVDRGPVVFWEHHTGTLSDNGADTYTDKPRIGLHFLCHFNERERRTNKNLIWDYTKSLAHKWLAKMIYDSRDDGCGWRPIVAAAQYQRLRYPKSDNSFGYALMLPIEFPTDYDVDWSDWKSSPES